MANLQNLLRNSLQQKSLDDICASISVKYSRHKEHPNLISFHYISITNSFDNLCTCESRGIVLDESDNWKIISYPYNKFFNYGEKNAAIIDWSSAKFFEKIDGSFMTLYFYKNKWYISSSSKPDATGRIGAKVVHPIIKFQTSISIIDSKFLM